MNKNLHTNILRYLDIYKAIAPPDAVVDFTGMLKEDLSLCHFGLVLYILNNYLTCKSELYQLFISNGISHPDDMSSFNDTNMA